jgi:pyridoxal phosphate enzyme (YggS family)
MSGVEGLKEVQEKIAAAEKRAGRLPGSCRLIAVSKTKPIEAIKKVFQQGVGDFGENYVQEALEKMETLTAEQIEPRWHFIGHLQTNKAKSVVGRFDCIHSVDRVDLAKALNKRAAEMCVSQKILIEVNLGNEESKSGVAPSELSAVIKEIILLENLFLEGLMALPPLEENSQDFRKYFKELAGLRRQKASMVPSSRGSFKELSMGTTHDYEIAVEEGATFVRVGTAIFGARERSKND